jgi:hypothetical protein
VKKLFRENRTIKRLLTTTCIFTTSIAISSCSGLKSKNYVGKIMVISEEDLSNESIWMYGGDAYYVRRSQSNTFIAATLEWNEKEKGYTKRSFPLFLSELGDHTFLNIEDNDLYTVFRATYSGENSVVLFRVDRKKVERDIAAGIVCAHTNRHDVILDGSKTETDEYIQNNAYSMFSMDSASIAELISEKKKQ